MRPPRSSIRETSLNLPVDLLATIHSLVVILESREPQRFLAPEREVPVHGKRLVEELVDTLLQVPVEVDEHVATKNDVALREGAIGDEVVLGEDDVAHEPRSEQRAVVHRGVVLAERARAPGAQVVLRVLLHAVEREDAFLRLLDDDLVDVGRVDPRPVVEVLLFEEDRHGIRLLPGRAPGMPDPDERVGAQGGHDVAPKRRVEPRVTEHGRDVDGEVEQQPLHHDRIVQHTVLKRAEGARMTGVDALPDATPERCVRVRPEIESVMAVDALEEQLDLDALQVGVIAVRGRLGRGGDVRDRWRRDLHGLRRLDPSILRSWLYLYSHTRIRESSCSGSTGFVM